MSSAIARALGAGDRDRAESLATHALLIAVLFGLVFMLGRTLGLGQGLLNLTMVCPFTTKSRKAETSAEARQEHSET